MLESGTDLHTPPDEFAARSLSLMQLTARRIVDYAAQYITTRNAHLEALNDLVLSMGPYLTALKAYSTALKSYAVATEEKAKHIVAMRDLEKNAQALNDAKAIIAFNELKSTGASTDNRPHDFCPDT